MILKILGRDFDTRFLGFTWRSHEISCMSISNWSTYRTWPNTTQPEHLV